MLFDLSKFDEYREDNRREVKKAKGGLPNSLWDTYSSFANCYGGVIILGVAENADGSWTTTGLENERKLLKDFWDTINNKKKVSLNLLTNQDVELYHAEGSGDIIIVIHVPSAKREDKPVYLNNDMFGGTYRRNWEGDYHCSAQEVKAMLRDQPEATMDMKVLDFAPMEYINRGSVAAYRNRHSAYKPGHPWVKLDYEEYLEQIGAAAISTRDGKLHPTAAGLLMFGEEYHIVREFPEYFLDYREMLDPSIRWTDRVHSSSGEWSGNIFDFFFMVYNKLLKEIKTPFRIENGIRIDDTPVHKALREALANCLVNTDYYLPRAVVIKLTPENIVLENPGSIRTGKNQMLKGGISDPRNKTLMKMFNLINIGERAGSGVPDIYSVWEAQGWEDPTVIEQYGPDRTILTLPLVKKVAVKSGGKKVAVKSGGKKVAVNISDRKQAQYNAVLTFMHSGQDYTAADFCDILGVKISRTKVLLKELVELGKVEIVGSFRNRRYRLK